MADRKREREEDGIVVKFRNYQPRDGVLRQGQIEAETVPDAEETIEKAIKLVEEKENKEEEALNIAPKKLNWDLKRDVEGKLKKLDKRTQKAIVEMIKVKMEAEGDSSDSSDSSDESD